MQSASMRRILLLLLLLWLGRGWWWLRICNRAVRSTPSQPPAVIVSISSPVLRTTKKESNASESKRRNNAWFLPYLGSGFFSSGSILPHCGYSDRRLDSYHGNVGRKIINNSGGAATVGARPSQPKLKQGGHNGKESLGQWEWRNERLTARPANQSAPDPAASVSLVAFPMECFQPHDHTKLKTHDSFWWN